MAILTGAAASVPPDLPRLERAPRRTTTVRREAGASRAPAWLRWVLGAPLTWKLVGMNVLVGLLAALAVVALHDAGAGLSGLAAAVAGAIAVSVTLSFVVARVALQPLDEVEATADRVWRGDFAARVPASLLADRDMARLGHTLNLLLDGIERDRAQMRRLAAQIIAAQDEERARVARELHDSVAQTMAALVLQLSAARRTAGEGALGAQLELVRSLAGDALEEVRLLSHTVYPRVLEDLGLVAALEWLARQTQEAEELTVTVRSAGVPAELPPAQAAALYRVAQEALRNAIRHARARRVRFEVTSGAGAVTLAVSDDGRGFSVAEAEERRPGMGLFAMRERVALVDGSLEIESTPGAGTRVRATVPISNGQGA